MLDITKEEAQGILMLINRVSVNGQEVESVAYLKNKLKVFIEAPITPTQNAKPEVPAK